MGFLATKKEQKRYETFVAGLTKLSKEHGVLIQAIGGVMILNPKELENLVYDQDASSGDLTHNLFGE